MWGPGDTQLVGRIVARARAGTLPVLGRGAALIDTTYADNAVAALVAALDACQRAHGSAVVVSNGEPRPVGEVVARLCAPPACPRRGGGCRPGSASWPVPRSTASGRAPVAPAPPPLTRFLAEQLTTAHWFDQRRTRELLDWSPTVGLDEGFVRLADWYASGVHPFDT